MDTLTQDHIHETADEIAITKHNLTRHPYRLYMIHNLTNALIDFLINNKTRENEETYFARICRQFLNLETILENVDILLWQEFLLAKVNLELFEKEPCEFYRMRAFRHLENIRRKLHIDEILYQAQIGASDEANSF